MSLDQSNESAPACYRLLLACCPLGEDAQSMDGVLHLGQQVRANLQKPLGEGAQSLEGVLHLGRGGGG